MRFTVRAIQSLKPGDARQEFTETGVSPDRRGLMLRVYPSGSKVFLHRFKIRGKTYRVKLGSLPHFTLEQAHEAIAENRRLLQAGINPARQAPDREDCTVQAMAEEWLTRYVARERKDNAEPQRMLDKDVLPYIGERDPDSITTREVVKILDRIIDRGSPIAANRCHSLLKQVFKYGRSRGWYEGANPCADVERPQKREPSRERVLTDDELETVWSKLDTAKMRPYMRLIYRLILATGQRPGEVQGAEWAEFDLTTNIWTIPATRTKNGKLHEVPLTRLALDLLAELRELHEDERWLFPSYRKAVAGPIESKAGARAIRNNREHFEVDAWTPHDLRRTVRTGLAKLGIDAITAKKVLNHSLQGMDRVYDQHDYADEKRRALDTWSEHLAAVVAGKRASVVPIESVR